MDLSLPEALKYSQDKVLNGALVDAAFRSKNKSEVDRTALGVLGDHLQELGVPAGKILSHFATGGQPIYFKSLSANPADEVYNTERTHRVIVRKGVDREGKPLVWVSVSRWKKVPLDNGNTRLDKDRSWDAAFPSEHFEEYK